MTNLPQNQKVVESTKKTRKKRNYKETKRTSSNEISAREPIRTTKWHHSSFPNAIKREFMRYFQKQSPNVFCKKCVLKNFANFTGKHMFKSLFKKVTGLQACMFIKKRLQHRCFLWTLQNFQGHLFWSTSANDFFCIFEILTTNNIIFILAENFIFNFRIYKILCILQLHQIYVSFSVFLANNFQYFSENF